MKKMLLIVTLFMLAACSPKTDVTSSQMAVYRAYVRQISKADAFYDYTKDFKARLIYNKLGKYYSYDLIISDPKTAMYDIRAVSYSSQLKDSYHPSIGIFDKERYHLVPGVVNKKKGYVKGFDLSGRVYKQTDIRMKITFYTNKKHTRKVSHIIKVKYENR